jgi:DNA-binding transcriptional ArsR family regulator
MPFTRSAEPFQFDGIHDEPEPVGAASQLGVSGHQQPTAQPGQCKELRVGADSQRWGWLGSAGLRDAWLRICRSSYITRVASTFEVLAEPRRREILDLLRTRERPVGDLVERLNLSQPAVSKHLKVLREAGLVEVRHDAQRRWYRLRLQPLVEVDEWLAPYRRLWNERLDALERHLETMPDERT